MARLGVPMTRHILHLTLITIVFASAGSGGMTSRVLPFSSAVHAVAQPSAGALTPASVALLVNNWDAQAIDTARRAIASDDPAIRAVSARLAGSTGSAELADAIATALEREKDPLVAVEQARALLFLRGAAAEELIKARFATSSEIANVYAEWLSRVRPETLADALPAIASALGGDRIELNSHVRTALDRRPESSEPLLRAWLGAGTPVSWRAFLDRLLIDPSRPGQDTVLIEALNSKDAGIREATVWDLVVRLAQGRPVPAAVLDATVPVVDQDPAATVTWEQFGREVVGRHHASRRTPDRAALVTAEGALHASDSRALAVLPQTTEPERRALQAVLGERFPKRLDDYRRSAPIARVGPATRTLPAIWPGLLKGLTEAVACKTGSPPGLASVVYRTDGRVERGDLNKETLTPACEQVAAALARLTIADAQYPPPANAPEWLVLPFEKDYIECVSGPAPSTAEKPAKLGQGGSVTPPRKTRDVKPFYPVEMQQRGITGTVVLESVITKTGCVRSVRVMRSVAPPLDHAAVRAVSGWQFTPTKIDGREVPVIMTVTISFTLQ
jgi:TonB family protein